MESDRKTAGIKENKLIRLQKFERNLASLCLTNRNNIILIESIIKIYFKSKFELHFIFLQFTEIMELIG